MRDETIFTDDISARSGVYDVYRSDSGRCWIVPTASGARNPFGRLQYRIRLRVKHNLTVEAGKRYWTRDGRIVGPMQDVSNTVGVRSDRWKGWIDGNTAVSYWNDNGAQWVGRISAMDLVREYVEPDADPGEHQEILDAIEACNTGEEI